MLVPRLVEDLHEPHAPLDHAAGEQAPLAEFFRLLLVEAVQRLRLGRFVAHIDQLRRGRLHAKRQLVRLDPRRQFVIVIARGQMLAV